MPPAAQALISASTLGWTLELESYQRIKIRNGLLDGTCRTFQHGVNQNWKDWKADWLNGTNVTALATTHPTDDLELTVFWPTWSERTPCLMKHLRSYVQSLRARGLL